MLVMPSSSTRSAVGTWRSNEERVEKSEDQAAAPTIRSLAGPSLDMIPVMFAAIGDTPYKIMLLVHILAIMVAFAPAFVHHGADRPDEIR